MPTLVLILSLFAPGSGAMQRFALTHLLAATGGRAVEFDGADARFSRIVTDSREAGPDDLFVAIRGERFDGHQYTTAARSAGATASIVDATWADRVVGPRIVVPNTRLALADIARAHRGRNDTLVVGVTGSVGKTTTRELVHSVLSSRFAGTRSPKNFNNDLGVPLTLLGIEESHEYAVVEVGASGRGEIGRLAEIAQPDVAVVTRIAPAHLAGFGCIETIAEEKGELVAGTHGFAVLNGDDRHVRAMRGRANGSVILVGESQHNDLRGSIESVDLGRLRLRVDGSTFEVPATGRHHLVPALAAIAIGREVGLATSDIAEGLARFEPVTGRCRVESIGPWTVVDDSYNASPAAMQAACELLAECPANGPRILVAGDMLDLGDDADERHAELARTIAETSIDHLLFHGARAERVATEARHWGMDAHRLAACPDLDALTAVLDCLLDPGAVVLVKGSRGMRMERVVAWMRHRAEELESARVPARAA